MSTIERLSELAEAVMQREHDVENVGESLKCVIAFNRDCNPAAIAQAYSEYAELERRNAELVGALEKLARLGNGDHYGNSEGNMIARAALAHSAKEAT